MNEQFVYVAIYEHKYGTDVAVFQSETSAWKWADEIAKTYWDDHYPDEPMPKENIGKAYFNSQYGCGDEWFTVEHRQVEP